jgi:membrane fusion protein, multidrug efflux system
VPRNIRAGQWLGEHWIVLDGLKAGENVIVDNVARLRPGTPIEPRKPG